MVALSSVSQGGTARAVEATVRQEATVSQQDNPREDIDNEYHFQ